MKILQVVDHFPFSGLGGSFVYTGQLVQALGARHDVRLFYSTGGAPHKTVEQGSHNGIAYWALGKDYLNFDRPFHERSRWVEHEFAKALDRFRPDIIHFQHLINLSLNLPGIAKQRGIGCCFTLHDFWLLCPRYFLLDNNLQLCPGYDPGRCTGCLADRIGYYGRESRGALPLRILRRRAKQGLNYAKNRLWYFSLALWRPHRVQKIFRDVDLFIAPSHFLRQKYMLAGLPERRIVFCRHGLDGRPFGNIRKTPAGFLRFAYIGGMGPVKGLDILIAAFNGIAAPHELKIYGSLDPAARGRLERKIQNPRIRLMGRLREEDKRAAFAEMDALILPSVCYENCPLVILEAFMAKTPVITSDLGGMAELVENGISGLTFPSGDSAGLARRITMLIDDRGLAGKLSARVPPVKDMAAHADEIVQLYRSVRAS